MSEAIEGGFRDRLVRSWSRRGPLRVALTPAAWLFRLGVALRRAAYRVGLVRPRAPGVPVLSIGNLTVGGTGKTPFALWLTQRLVAAGWRPALVTRGYSGALAKRVLTVGEGGRALFSVEEIGDEAMLLAERAGVPVVCGADRVAAAEKAVAEHGVDLIVLDDGFQHWRLGRSVDIVLVDGIAGFGNGSMLPAGPMREGLAALRRADAIVVTKTAEVGALAEIFARVAPGVPVFAAAYAPAAVVQSEEGVLIERALGMVAGRKVVTVSAIADPSSFYALLGELEVQPVDVLEFPDHHVFDRADWQQISKVAHTADLIVCTEKDLVKLRDFPFARGRLVALRLELRLDPADEESLLRVVAEKGGLVAGCQRIGV
ncbi:MAG: tetraacyldisaccharide 4'-kinase [Deltaproteobacteria bacterium]